MLNDVWKLRVSSPATEMAFTAGARSIRVAPFCSALSPVWQKIQQIGEVRRRSACISSTILFEGIDVIALKKLSGMENGGYRKVITKFLVRSRH
jgi:hypothetical protein